MINKKCEEKLLIDLVGLGENGDEDGTINFDISVSTFGSNFNSLPICKGCNREFRSIKNDITRRHVYMEQCIKECDKQAIG